MKNILKHLRFLYYKWRYVGSFEIPETYENFRAIQEIFVHAEYEPLETPSHILDLGANVRLASIYLSRRFPSALIHAYEPSPETFDILKRNARKLRNVSVFQKGIGARSENREFFVYPRSISSSIFPSNEARKITVPFVSLNDAIRQMLTSNSDYHLFIKIDVEGAEYELFPLLPATAEVIGEIHPDKKPPGAITPSLPLPKGKGIFRIAPQTIR